MSHLFLIGFMGAGKSTAAREIAESLGRPCVDLDETIEREASRPVARIFAEDGEDVFRALESAALETLSGASPSVVACGGGIVVRAENRAALKRLGTVVYLKVTSGEALARIGDAGSRPLLAGASGALAATTLLQARESLYRSVADITVDTVGSTAAQVADTVVAILAEKGLE